MLFDFIFIFSFSLTYNLYAFDPQPRIHLLFHLNVIKSSHNVSILNISTLAVKVFRFVSGRKPDTTPSPSYRGRVVEVKTHHINHKHKGGHKHKAGVKTIKNLTAYTHLKVGKTLHRLQLIWICFINHEYRKCFYSRSIIREHWSPRAEKCNNPICDKYICDIQSLKPLQPMR